MQLINILGSKNKIKLIRFLIKHQNWEFNITELSKDLMINKGNISKLIKELGKNDIITINNKGKILLLKLNKNNRFVKNALIPLFKKEESFFNGYLNKIVKVLKHKNIISIILYGSIARGEAKLDSDIDILVISKNKDENIKEKIKNIEDNIIINIDIMTLKEFKKAYNEKEPLIKNILNNNKVLYGKKVLEMV